MTAVTMILLPPVGLVVGMDDIAGHVRRGQGGGDHPLHDQGEHDEILMAAKVEEAMVAILTLVIPCGVVVLHIRATQHHHEVEHPEGTKYLVM